MMFRQFPEQSPPVAFPANVKAVQAALDGLHGNELIADVLANALLQKYGLGRTYDIMRLAMDKAGKV